MKNLLQGKNHPTSCHSEMMTEPAEHAKRSKLNMVIRLFACQCSLWRHKQPELKYQTRGEIACNSYDGRMSLEHVQDLSFCGFFFLFFTRVQRVYLCPLLPLAVFWDIVALWGVVVWFALQEWPTQAGDCHVEMSSRHCCFQLVARANSSLHTFKQQDCVLRP